MSQLSDGLGGVAAGKPVMIVVWPVKDKVRDCDDSMWPVDKEVWIDDLKK